MESQAVIKRPLWTSFGVDSGTSYKAHPYGHIESAGPDRSSSGKVWTKRTFKGGKLPVGGPPLQLFGQPEQDDQERFPVEVTVRHRESCFRPQSTRGGATGCPQPLHPRLLYFRPLLEYSGGAV